MTHPLTCDDARTSVLLHAGGDLPRQEVHALETHLGGCSACAQELEVMRRVLRAVHDLRSGQPVELPEDFAGRVAALARARASRGVRWWRRRSTVAAGWAVAATVAAAAVATVFVGTPARNGGESGLDSSGVASTSPADFRWEQLERHLPGCLDRPVPIDEWNAPDQPGVVAFLQKPDPERRPDTYVLAYCVEGSRLSAGRSYPWVRQRFRRLSGALESGGDIYVAACALPDTEPRERRELARDLMRAFHPVLNETGGV